MLQKGFSAIPTFLSGQLGSSNQISEWSNFVRFFHKFSQLRNKNEEKELITKEIKYLKQKLSQPNLSLKIIRECLVELMYCHLIGYDVSFAYIHAINLAQQGATITKRTGYLLCSLFFDEKHELSLLLVNTILKDLQSTNLATVSTALVSCGHMLTLDTLSSVLDSILKKLNHSKEIIRKKSLHCLLSLVNKYPELANKIAPHLPKHIDDNDPGVVSIVVEIYIIISKANPAEHRYIIQPLIKILGQLVAQKISDIHNYNGIRCLWLQISIIKLITSLASGDYESKQVVLSALRRVLKRTETKYRAGLSVVYEALMSIIKLSAEDDDFSSICSQHLDVFIYSKYSNIKLAGVKLLSEFISKCKEASLAYQSVILDSLDSEDDSIQSAALDLLYGMANPVNKDVICKKLLSHADLIKEEEKNDVAQSKESIYRNVIGIINRFSNEDPSWYVDRVFNILPCISSLPHLVNMVTCKFMSFLNEDAVKGEKSPSSVILKAVEKSFQLVEDYQSDESRNDLICFPVLILGKFAHLSPQVNVDELFSTLIGLFYSTCDVSVRRTCLYSLANCFSVLTNKSEGVEMLALLKDAIDPNELLLLQDLKELLWIFTNDDGSLIQKINNQSEFDYSLSFLDEYVCSSLERGGAIYNPRTNHPPKKKIINIHGNNFNNNETNTTQDSKIDVKNIMETLDLENIIMENGGGWTMTGYNQS